MNNIIDDITQQLLRKLPENKKYFTPNELLEFGIPDFVVKRVNIEIRENLLNSLNIPETDWANTDTQDIRHAWNTFIEELMDNRWLPREYVSSVLENAVQEILTILVEPQKNIPKVIFDDETVLKTSEIEGRSQKIVVYPHFSQALQRYLHKRELDEMTKERCGSVVRQIDQKMSEKYTPLTWLQLLSPWLTLMGNRIDADLLRRFFEEKGKTDWADYFGAIKTQVDGDQVLKVLSDQMVSKPLDKQNGLVEQKPETLGSESSGNEASDFKETPLHEQFANKEPEVSNDESDGDSHFVDHDMEENHQEEKEEVPEKPEVNGQKNDDVDDIPIWQRFIQNSDSDDNALVNRLSEQEKSADPADVDEEQADDKDDNNEFAARTLADILAERNNAGYEPENDREDDGQSIINLYNRNSEAADEKIKVLYSYIDDQKDYFIDHIFGGDENALRQALNDVAKYSTWQEASRYISREIFRRNMIDIYTEVAIDFTDRLQSYFMEHNNSD